MDSFTREDEAGDDDAAFGLTRLSQEGENSSRKHDRQHADPAESVSSSLHSSCNARFNDSGHGFDDKEAASKRSRLEPEGEYMAALRGTHSETWQAMTSKARSDVKPRYGAASSASAKLGFDSGGLQGGNLGACLHCGKEGHWARDCPSKSFNSSPWGPVSTAIPSQSQVPERSCPCGGGLCTVLTANIEKNAGRQFYRCPLRKEEEQCGFFEWCDANTSTGQGLSKERGGNQNPSELSCPCGAGLCITLTAKTEKNMGRQFYRCPLNQGEGSCGFFKWCDENLPATSTAPAYGEGQCGFFEWCDANRSTNQGLSKERGDNQNPSELSCPCGAGLCITLTAKTEKNMGRQFYRCPLNQGEGSCGFFKWCDENLPATSTAQHWANSAAHSNAPKAFGGTMRPGMVRSGAMSTCYKCDQVGHWAKDCPNQQFSPGSNSTAGGVNRYGGEAHAPRGFGNASGYGRSATAFRSAGSGYGGSGTGVQMGAFGSAGSGACFKCGSHGHWPKDCPNARPNSFGGQSQISFPRFNRG